ncbi:hypothetical protein SLA2020_520890 [Shorea laevis]
MKRLWRLQVLQHGIFTLFLLLLVLTWTQANDDVLMLMAFKKFSVTSDPHAVLVNWTDTSSSPCSWHGVTCSLDGRVSTLDLSYAGLVGSLHLPNLIAMSALCRLYLQGNSFSAGDLFASSSCMLDTLDLSSNNFSNPLPGPGQSFFMLRVL